MHNIRDRMPSTLGTSHCHMREKQYLCNAILKDRLHSRFRPHAEACESQASPKQVPSKSHFFADKDGRQKGRTCRCEKSEIAKVYYSFSPEPLTGLSNGATVRHRLSITPSQRPMVEWTTMPASTTTTRTRSTF